MAQAVDRIPDKLACVSDNVILILDIASGTVVQKMRCQTLRDIVVLGNNKLVSSDDAGLMQVWDMKTGKCLKRKQPISGWPISSLCVLSSNTVIYQPYREPNSFAWNIVTDELKNITALRAPVHVIDENTVFGYHVDTKSLKTYDVSTEQLGDTIEIPMEPMYRMLYNGHGSVIILNTQSDTTIRVHDVHTGALTKEFNIGGVYNGSAKSISKDLIAVGEDELNLYDITTGKHVSKFEKGSGDRYCSDTVIIDQKTAATGLNSCNGGVALWDYHTGSMIKQLDAFGETDKKKKKKNSLLEITDIVPVYSH
jgi:WD40 repeat protein